MDKGEIYMLFCKTSRKAYIGQAGNYISDKTPWGSKKRWRSHVREATSHCKDHCRVLNCAIRKYGSDDFTLRVLGEFLIEELDYYETEYIKIFETMIPNGYNMNEGGARGKDSEETKLRKKQAKIGHRHSDETKESIAFGQIGNRRAKKKRKYEEDKDLPKYICAIRRDGEIFGYVVKCFPIGVTKKVMVPDKYFCNKNLTVKQNLTNTLEYLTELKKTYSYIDVEIEKMRKEREEMLIKKKLENKRKIKITTLPENIAPIYKKNRLIGYSVQNIRDHENNILPIKNFTERQLNIRNLKNAKKYIKSVEIKNEDEQFTVEVKDEDDIYINGKNRSDDKDKNLPRYLSVIKVKGVRTGYFINNFPVRTKDGKITQRIKKKFCDTKLLMEEKYKMANDYLNELKEEHIYWDNSDANNKLRKEKVLEDMPEYIYPIYDKETGNKRVGYYVEYIDSKENKHLRKDFKDCVTLWHNMRQAKWYIEDIERDIKDKDFLVTNSIIEKYMYTTTKDDKIIGYRIQYPIKDKSGKTVKKKKSFCDPKLNLEEKYNLTVEHLHKLKGNCS